MNLQLCLGVGEGAVVAPGTAAVLGQVSAQAGLVPGHMAPRPGVTLPRPPVTREGAVADQASDHGQSGLQTGEHLGPADLDSDLGLRSGVNRGQGVQVRPQAAQVT